MLKFGFCYQQAIYTRKQNIDFDLPWFHSHVSNIPKVRESDRQASRQPIVFFFFSSLSLVLFVCVQCFRENYRQDNEMCICVCVCVCVHYLYLFLFIVFFFFRVHMNIYQCMLILFTCDLKITFFFRSSYMNMALISLKH